VHSQLDRRLERWSAAAPRRAGAACARGARACRRPAADGAEPRPPRPSRPSLPGPLARAVARRVKPASRASRPALSDAASAALRHAAVMRISSSDPSHCDLEGGPPCLAAGVATLLPRPPFNLKCRVRPRLLRRPSPGRRNGPRQMAPDPPPARRRSPRGAGASTAAEPGVERRSSESCPDGPAPGSPPLADRRDKTCGLACTKLAD